MPDSFDIASLPAVKVPVAGSRPNDLLETEWLLADGRGGFASSTVVGANTRRYHSLLTVARKPPVDRWNLLANVLARVTVNGKDFDLSNFEFPGAFHPQGWTRQIDCEQDASVRLRWNIDWNIDCFAVRQEIFLLRGSNAVAVRWCVEGPHDPIGIHLMPVVANRGMHSLRRRDRSGTVKSEPAARGVSVRFDEADAPTLHLSASAGVFEHRPDWWHNFLLRTERDRGHDHIEDLFVPGWFHGQVGGSEGKLTLIASDAPMGEVDFDKLLGAERDRRLAVAVKFAPADEVEARLAVAADAFIVERKGGGGKQSIIAGYPWFSDWGRDTFIALPGLLLAGRRYDEAREVIRTFAAECKDGLIPNRFEDDGKGADYNTVDGALWLVHAVGEHFRAAKDIGFVREVGLPVCEKILEGYRKGTKFDIHETADGLISAGDDNTQLTWMDAKCNGTAFTPRQGCAVEIAALWHHAQRVTADLRRAVGRPVGDLDARAAKTGLAIADKFWDDLKGHLADVVRGDERDTTLRPNQLLAVSLAPCPLPISRQQAIVAAVEEKLLTPVGLRTLPPGHPNYRSHYVGDPWNRDASYHQGTVWAWLIGPYVEALLRAHDFSRPAVDKAARLLTGFDKHLRQAGLGQVSEIFDAEAPHHPRGCIAQAWSVAELIRAKQLVKLRRR